MPSPVAFVGGPPGRIGLLIELFVSFLLLVIPFLIVYYLHRIDKRLGRLVELRER